MNRHQFTKFECECCGNVRRIRAEVDPDEPFVMHIKTVDTWCPRCLNRQFLRLNDNHPLQTVVVV